MADKQNKEYIVKVPIYTSENIRNEDSLFGSTYDNMIQYAKESIAKYNSDDSWHVTSDKRSKTSITGVNKIDVAECSIGQDACLLLQATAYKTKLMDGYYESEESEIIIFKENDKLCSNTHFILLYPNIFKDIVYWRVFVYEDPSKTNDEVTRVAKLIMKDILKQPIRNIKEDKLLSDISEQGIISGMEISFISLNDDDDETYPYLLPYLTDSKMKKEKKIKLENIPSEECVKAYKDIGFQNSYTKKQIKYLLSNKRVLTVTQEFRNNLLQTFEDSFNYSFGISEVELKEGHIFDKDFIIDHMSGVITNFMSLNSDN